LPAGVCASRAGRASIARSHRATRCSTATGEACVWPACAHASKGSRAWIARAALAPRAARIAAPATQSPARALASSVGRATIARCARAMAAAARTATVSMAAASALRVTLGTRAQSRLNALAAAAPTARARWAHACATMGGAAHIVTSERVRRAAAVMGSAPTASASAVLASRHRLASTRSAPRTAAGRGGALASPASASATPAPRGTTVARTPAPTAATATASATAAPASARRDSAARRVPRQSPRCRYVRSDPRRVLCATRRRLEASTRSQAPTRTRRARSLPPRGSWRRNARPDAQPAAHLHRVPRAGHAMGATPAACSSVCPSASKPPRRRQKGEQNARTGRETGHARWVKHEWKWA